MNWFYFFCLPARIALTYLTLCVPKDNRLLLLLLTMSIGIMVIYICGLRRTGWETNGKPIWWDSYRPLHASLWMAAVLFPPSVRYIPLALDTLLGVYLYESRVH